jgi:hypothetical protein
LSNLALQTELSGRLFCITYRGKWNIKNTGFFSLLFGMKALEQNKNNNKRSNFIFLKLFLPSPVVFHRSNYTPVSFPSIVF